jgi:hypothetical protein
MEDKNCWAELDCISKSPVFMVFSDTVIDLYVLVLLNISASLKNDDFYPSIASESTFFVDFFVSVLDAILSIMVMKMTTTKVRAKSQLKMSVDPPTNDFGSTV